MFKIPAFFIRLFFVLFFLISILFVLQSKKSFPKEVLAVPGALILPSTASYVTVTSTNITTTSLTLGGVLVTVNGSKLNMLSGVTSEIQAQINLKAPTASPTFTGIATAPTFSGALSGNATTATTATTANALSFNGGLTTTSNPTFNSVYLADTNQRIYQGAGTSLHTQTAYGYIEIGPQNTSWAHLQTDRPAFYFNKQVTIDGNLCKYTGNCYDINTLIYSGNIGSQSVNYAASAPWSGISGKPTAITRIQDLTGSYGSINVAGTTNGYAGINFVDEGSTFMVDLGGATGMYRNTGSWQWYFDSNGSLTAGSVPWGNVSGKPTTVAGYGITDMGSQSVNNATNATNVVPGGNVYTDTVNTASANDALEINYYRSGAVKICATLNCGLVSAFFAQSGNVGIGTITPGAQLDVAPIPLVPWDNFTVGDDRSWDGTTSHVGISDGHHHLMFNTTPHLTYQAANGGAFVRMAAAANAANSWDMGLLADVFTIRRNGTGSFLTINNGGLATFSGNVTAPTFVGNLTGVASNATQATTATSLTSMNISQFTNNSGYITAGNSSFTGQYIYQDYAAQAAHNILGYAGSILGYASKGLFQYSNNFIYPGRVDAAGFWQNSWYLASHASYGLYTNTGLYTAGNITAPSAVFSAAVTSPNFAVTAGEGNGVRFWQSDDYKISMGNGAEYHYGYVNDYSVKMNMTNGIGRGFTWGSNGTAVASLNASSGSMQIAGNFIALGSAAIGKTVLNAPLDVGHGNDAIAFYN